MKVAESSRKNPELPTLSAQKQETTFIACPMRKLDITEQYAPSGNDPLWGIIDQAKKNTVDDKLYIFLHKP